MIEMPSRHPSRTQNLVAFLPDLQCDAEPIAATHCTRACQQQAYRLRHHQPSRPDLATLHSELKRRKLLADQTVYECPKCERRSIGRR